MFFSHRQLVLHTMAQLGSLAASDEMPFMRSNTVYMPVTPMFHVHAWGVPYAATMLGIKQVYPGRYEPELLVDLIKEHKVTFSHCVPTIMQMMLATESIKTADLSNWHVLIGGSAMTEGLCRAGAKLVIVNREPTDMDAYAHLVMNAEIGALMDEVMSELESA